MSIETFDKADMSGPKAPTLDQLQVFLAIVEAGSFAAAARRLGRANSVISYAVANLERQLGVELFDRESTRKPRLTDAGKAVLSDARIIAAGSDGLLAKARGLSAGLEPEVSLVVDVMLPMPQLVDVLEAFQAAFPTVALRLYVEALGMVVKLVLDQVTRLGICGPLDRQIDGLQRHQIGGLKLIPVAAPSHPLSQHKGRVNMAVARDHVQLVLTDRSTLTDKQEFSVFGLRTWRLADLGAKHRLLLAGIGWGSMPEPMVRSDLAAGRLMRLALDAWDADVYVLQAVYRTDTPLGPAAGWLLDKLQTAHWGA
jgi:DNA-binding transcriptional LysR family regulator